MIVTTQLQGRLGNNFYQIATCIAYAKRHGMKYFIPDESPHMPGRKNVFTIQDTYTGKLPVTLECVREITREDGQRKSGIYESINKKSCAALMGYWQSFKYFDDYREDVIKAFGLPYKKNEGVSIHVRRGDYLKLAAFEVLPMEYYEKCISFFKEKGYKKFIVFSDDIAWCKQQFKDDAIEFVFREGCSELEDFIAMSCCEHDIVANSSFSFAAAWLNQNPGKIVLCPDKSYCWFNDEYIPEYYTVMPC